jgi:hypothetical protein
MPGGGDVVQDRLYSNSELNFFLASAAVLSEAGAPARLTLAGE